MIIMSKNFSATDLEDMLQGLEDAAEYIKDEWFVPWGIIEELSWLDYFDEIIDISLEIPDYGTCVPLTEVTKLIKEEES